MNRFYKLVMILISLFVLSGCSKVTKTYYTYGPDNSCFQDKPIKHCDRFKPYDELTISLNKQNNEVTYELSALGLDASNTVFKKLTNCKIIDLNNFSCEDFASIHGRITNYKSIGDRFRLFSSSSLLQQSFLSPQTYLNKRSIELFDDLIEDFESHEVLIYILFGMFLLICIFYDGKTNEKN